MSPLCLDPDLDDEERPVGGLKTKTTFGEYSHFIVYLKQNKQHNHDLFMLLINTLYSIILRTK